jgi:acetyl-CoA carboxylase carboxyltransferase component
VRDDLAMAPGDLDPDAPRGDLAAVRERHALGLDAARAEAVARRREQGRRTARENLADLVDEGTFVEYGPLLFAAQERRRSRQELIARTPADGLVAGVGDVRGAPCVVMSYDYTVLAGTQGMRGHLKKDRWPTSEFGGMGLEGAVRLGMRRELDAIDDPEERERAFQALVAAAYEHGQGMNMAAHGEIDDVIDPADSRRWIATLFGETTGRWWRRPGKKRPNIDTW